MDKDGAQKDHKVCCLASGLQFECWKSVEVAEALNFQKAH